MTTLKAVASEALKTLIELLVDAHDGLIQEGERTARRNDGTSERMPSTYNRDKEAEIGTIHASIACVNHVLALQMRERNTEEDKEAEE